MLSLILTGRLTRSPAPLKPDSSTVALVGLAGELSPASTTCDVTSFRFEDQPHGTQGSPMIPPGTGCGGALRVMPSVAPSTASVFPSG